MAVDFGALLILIPTLLGLWVIVSIPVYIAARVVTGGRAKFTRAMGATVLGPMAYFGVVTISSIILGSIVGGIATIPAIILALLVWLWIYKVSFRTGWLASIGIAVIAIIVFVVASFGIMFAIGILMPDASPPPLPGPMHQV